jgi:hypothetical protein
MLLSFKNRQQEACLKANKDEKERLEEVNCKYRIALFNTCKVVEI